MSPGSKTAFSSQTIGVNFYIKKYSKSLWRPRGESYSGCFVSSLSGIWSRFDRTPIFSHSGQIARCCPPTFFWLVVSHGKFCFSFFHESCICMFCCKVLSVCVFWYVSKFCCQHGHETEMGQILLLPPATSRYCYPSCFLWSGLRIDLLALWSLDWD